MNEKKQLIIGITGASGVVYAVRLLEVLKRLPHIETHLIISQAAKQTIPAETDFSLQQVRELATYNHDVRDIGVYIVPLMPCFIVCKP